MKDSGCEFGETYPRRDSFVSERIGMCPRGVEIYTKGDKDIFERVFS